MKNIFSKSKVKQQRQQQTDIPAPTAPTTPTAQTELLPHILNLPVFGNEINENLNEFVEKFESYTTTFNNEMKLNLLLCRLHGNAAQIIKPYLTTTSSYSDLVKILQEKRNEKVKLEIDLNEFATTLRKQINKQYPNSSGQNEKSRERLMINKFMERMPPKLNEKFQPDIQNFQTLQQLVDHVTTITVLNR